MHGETGSCLANMLTYLGYPSYPVGTRLPELLLLFLVIHWPTVPLGSQIHTHTQTHTQYTCQSINTVDILNVLGICHITVACAHKTSSCVCSKKYNGGWVDQNGT